MAHGEIRTDLFFFNAGAFHDKTCSLLLLDIKGYILHEYNNAENALFEIASAQGGYFTAFQASHAGFSNKNLRYHVEAGNWIREWRGIYRLARFLLREDAQYSLWGVWSMNRKGIPQGVYSHEMHKKTAEILNLLKA